MAARDRACRSLWLSVRCDSRSERRPVARSSLCAMGWAGQVDHNWAYCDETLPPCLCRNWVWCSSIAPRHVQLDLRTGDCTTPGSGRRCWWDCWQADDGLMSRTVNLATDCGRPQSLQSSHPMKSVSSLFQVSTPVEMLCKKSISSTKGHHTSSK